MLTLAILFTIGQIAFEEQPLPDVRIGPVTPFTGHPTTNFLQTDIDGDGSVDLLLPGYINFQEHGLFPERLRSPLPPCGGIVEADIFGGKLYYRGANSLAVFSWTEGQWRNELDQTLKWPGDDFSFGPVGTNSAVPVFRRFAYDLDEDGVPELVGLDAEGVHLYRRGASQYEPAGVLEVFPTTVINRSGSQAIWPPAERQVVLPEQRMSCRLLLMNHALAVVTDLESPEGQIRFRRDDIALVLDGEDEYRISSTRTTNSGELPAHVRPCHLNDDDIPDYAGAHWVLSDGAAVPMPVLETWASLDGGKTFQVERATTFHNFRPLTSFVDFDGDGDQDMVIEGTSLFEGGLRETINQYVTRSSIPHTIRIVPQKDGRFDTTAALLCEVQLDLEAPPVKPGTMLSRYQSGELINLTGDFDGDGYLDLALRRTSTVFEVRLARNWASMSPRPDASITVREGAQVSVADINGDKRADILVRWDEDVASGVRSNSVAYLSKETPR